MEYLHLFKDKTSHDAVYNGGGGEYQEPWVAYIEDDEMVTYNKPHDYSKDYFTIEALEDGNVYFKYIDEASTESQRYMEYSKDGGNTWLRTTNVDGQGVKMTIPLSAGEKAYVRGDNDALGISNEYGSYFYSDIEFDVFGNIMSLTFSDDFSNKFTAVENMFISLFYGVYDIKEGESVPCHVINAKNLVLPATTLDTSCYCILFAGCTSLTTAPELPATTLADDCYNSMFVGCISLTTAPELPATTLAQGCYDNMFSGCKSLTTAPELPASTLANYCYNYMFMGCTSLNYIKAMFTTTPSSTYTNRWVSGVASTGTFVKNSAATWNVTGTNGVPSGWTVETASA